MRRLALLIFVAGAAASQVVCAGENEDGWTTLRGAEYILHSGGATYPERPTKADRVMTVVFEDKAAKEVFDLIGPDAAVKCSPEKRDRERRKKGVMCTYTEHLNDPRDFHYTCWIGVNLRTGDGDVRISC